MTNITRASLHFVGSLPSSGVGDAEKLAVRGFSMVIVTPL